MTTLSQPPIGNSVRFAARPLGGGTPACIWLSAERRLPELDLTGCPELVVGAHPDDETLGFGATAVMLAQRRVRVQVVSASDGGGSHPGLSLLQRHRLELTRRAELHRALDVLGVPPPICLGLPDGAIADHQARLADLLIEVLAVRQRGTWCAATWRGDGHPDHEAVGRAAALAAAEVGAELVEYPVWMWHWAVPGDNADGDKVVGPRWRKSTKPKGSRRVGEARRQRQGIHPTTGRACDAVLDHAEHEEQDEFAKLEQDLSTDELERMGRAAKLAESIAPPGRTPGWNPRWPIFLFVGPFAAMRDRARDAILGKG